VLGYHYYSLRISHMTYLPSLHQVSLSCMLSTGVLSPSLL
jgi:hypothetical protein